jgi:hypothetical protein
MTLIQRCQGEGAGRWSYRRTFGVAERAAAEGTRPNGNARFGSNGCVLFSQKPLSRAFHAFTGQILKCTKGRFDPFATRGNPAIARSGHFLEGGRAAPLAILAAAGH